MQRPTILKVSSPDSKFLREEIFGPVVAIYAYEDSHFGKDLFKIIDETSEFALTGAIFANDRDAISQATEELRFSAGNFYIKYAFFLSLSFFFIFLPCPLAPTHARKDFLILTRWPSYQRPMHRRNARPPTLRRLTRKWHKRQSGVRHAIAEIRVRQDDQGEFRHY
jgi:hypothetical protein